MYNIHQKDIWIPPILIPQKTSEIPDLLLGITTGHTARVIRIPLIALYLSGKTWDPHISSNTCVLLTKYVSWLQTHSSPQNLQISLPGSLLRLTGVSAPTSVQNNLIKLSQINNKCYAQIPSIHALIQPLQYIGGLESNVNFSKYLSISPISLTTSSFSPFSAPSFSPSVFLFILPLIKFCTQKIWTFPH